MPEHINSFSRGVDRDTSLHLVPQDKATGLLNFRLSEEGGNGVAMVTLRGNERHVEVTNGFIPIGGTEYGGIAYIFSFNPATDEGEVGCFPSPDPSGTGGFLDTYLPLRNWNGVTDPAVGVLRQNFRTNLFAFVPERQLEVQPRIDFDGSVNLYFTDWNEPLRVINTGFHHQTAVYTSRMLWTGSWISNVHVFWESCAWPQRSNVRIIDGGDLYAGNYFLFFQYVTADLDTTNYNAQIGPIQVGRDLPTAGMTSDGAAGATDTNKTIEVTLSGLDTSYAYFRVAVVRHFEGTFEVWQMPENYPIDGAAATTTIRISTKEGGLDETIAGIVNRKGEETVVRSLAQLDNRMWGGAWKSQGQPYEEMAALAAQVRVNPAPAGQLEHLPDWWYGGGQPVTTLAQYKDGAATLDKVGYFRGEAYPFAVVFVFTGGMSSRPYPVQGYDAWFDPTATTPNQRGILRLPSNLNPGYHLYDAQGPRALGVRFDTSAVAVPTWFSKVCGFYFVRGERKPDLMYQGVWSPSWWMNRPGDSGMAGNPVDCGSLPSGVSLDCSNTVTGPYASNNSIAEFFPNMAFEEHVDPAVGNSEDYLRTGVANERIDRWGIFSTDHFFRKEIDTADYVVIPQGRWTIGVTTMHPDRSPSLLMQGIAFTPRTAYDPFNARLFNVAERNIAGTNGMTSAYVRGDDSNVGGPVMYYIKTEGDPPTPDRYRLTTQQMAQRNYIGVRSDQPGGGNIVNVARGEVVNIYDGNPAPISQGGSYDLLHKYLPATTLYFPISGFIPISDWNAVSNQTFYQGDCFLQRTWHRHLHSNGFGYNDATNGKFYAYGNIAGFVQECSINTAMRYEAGTTGGDQRYYPEKEVFNPLLFAAEFNSVDEARYRNAGYDNTLGIRSQLGDDQDIPFRGAEFNTRVRYTRAYVPGSFSDAFRKWDHDGFRDFDHRRGTITRIGVVVGRLAMVQENGTSFLYTTDRALMDPGASEGQLVLGIGDVLSEKAQEVSGTIGSQHQWSIAFTDLGMYGFDQSRRKAWRLTGQGFDILSTRLSFNTDALAASQLQSQLSDRIRLYPDAPVFIGGIASWMDRKNEEVGWSFILHEDGTHQVVTLAYSERYDAYLDKRSHASAITFNLNNDTYMVDVNDTLPVAGSIPHVGLWLHDSSPDRLRFFNRDSDASMSFSVHPLPTHPSVFEGMFLSSNDIPAARFEASTEFQALLLDPFMSLHEEDVPMYKENRWKLPILTATSVFGQGDHGYLIGSRMRGRRLEATFTWHSNLFVSVDAATTKFRPSFQ